MSDKGQFKLQGLHFARSLQMVIKMVNMFSMNHNSAAAMLRRSYDYLNPVLKQVRYLTIGFVEQRILLNNILTAESTLKPLENEFLKRGIGAISFDAGITFAAYTKAIGAISANPKTIQENGGLMPFLESKQLEFVRVFPAASNELRNEDGDTVLEMGSEEYLISKALSNIHSVPLHGIEGILSRMELRGTGETGFAEGSGFGAGNESSGGGFPGGSPGGSSGGSGSFSDIQRIADQKFEASLRNPQEDPQKAYVELGRILSNLRPDGILRNLAGGLDQAAANLAREVTADVFEDTALRWALRRLSSIPMGGDAVIVEEQIFRVLMRSLQATHAASKLAQKLADFAKDFVLPKQTLDRLQEEVRWLTLTSHGKLRELLGVEHFTPSQFRRTLDLIKDLIRMGSLEGAEALGVQYFAIFDDYPSIRIEEVGRIPELLQSLAGVQGEFWAVAEDRLTQALASTKLNRVIHVQTVNALVALAKVQATYENFTVVRRIGAALEESAAADPVTHASCCQPALALLLQPAAVDRVAEMFLERGHDSEWMRTATALLRWADPAGIERIFMRLDTEPLASHRLALIRLLGRVGTNGLAAARARLKRPEWYVVRNACKLLAELKDPELFEQLFPVFSYPDERVQKAALQAVKKSSLPQRKTAIAKALPLLPPLLLEEALDELAFQPDPTILPLLEEFLTGEGKAPIHAGVRAVQLLVSIKERRGWEALDRIAVHNRVEEPVRRAALAALGRHALEEKEDIPAQTATETQKISGEL